MTTAGMTALAVAFPETIRPNAYWTEHHPELVKAASDQALSRLWARSQTESSFERAMAPFAADPFKGALERRVLGPGETSVQLEAQALAALQRATSDALQDVDLAIVSAMRADSVGVGDGAWLAHLHGLSCPVINLETACSSSVMGLDTACSLVETGRYRKVLVVTSCTYSRDIDETSTLAWFLADGAGAFLVEAREGATVPLGRRVVSTAETCGAFVYELAIEDGRPVRKMLATKGAGTILHDTAEPYLRECCLGALEDAGVALADVSLFVFNTPTAWYAAFGAATLGVDPARTVSTYPIYTNIGPALMPANLHHAATRGRVSPGDLVLLYSVGSTSTAMALVLRWGDVALAPPPPPARSDWSDTVTIPE